MIDQCFRNDLEMIFRRGNAATFIDESGEAEFLLETLENSKRNFEQNK